MSDFYPVLARAVARLPIHGPQARQELYDHARTVLVALLHGQEPRVSAFDLIHEQAALETAIRKVEAKSLPDRSQSSKDRASRRLNALRVAAADVGMQTKIDKKYRSAQELRPNMARGRRPNTFLNRMGMRPGIKLTAETAADHKLYANNQLPADVDTLERIPDAAEQLPLGVATDDDIEILFPDRNTNGTPVVVHKPNGDARVRHERLTFNQTKARPASASAAEIDTSTKRRFLNPRIIGITFIVAILAIFAAICILVIASNFDRLVWFVEHLSDRPRTIVAIIIPLGLLLSMFLPIFGQRRKKSAISFLWHLITRSYDVNFSSGI